MTSSVSSVKQFLTFPDVVNETSEQASHDLQVAGFKVLERDVSVVDPGQDNIVQSQNPAGNSTATKGSSVTITIGQHSPGPPPPPTTTTTTTP